MRLYSASIFFLKAKKRKGRRLDHLAEPIPDDYLKGNKLKLEAVNLQEIYNAFSASSTHLFAFVMNYQYDKNKAGRINLYILPDSFAICG